MTQLIEHNHGSCLTRQQYRFTYDYANRLLTANHFTHNGTAWTNTNNYSESGISYDLNGNLKGYTRRGLTAPATFGVIDQLTYTYGDAARPDRLTNVSDAGSATKGFKFTSGAAAYTYDLNGNLTQDNHKSLSFQYNYLNLPNYISDAGGADITLSYTADGEKLSKVSTAGTRNYLSGIEYLGNALDAIYHAEGRCTPNGATAFYYEYTLKDHLGNARVNFRANGTAVTFLQELHYYPFGMLMEGLGTAKVTENGYKYNGKELNEDLGLNWSDFGKRWYDPSIARFPSVDPIIEKFPYLTPYNYASNDPVSKIDLWGLQGVRSPMAGVTPGGMAQYLIGTTGLTNDQSGIDKVKDMAIEVAKETGKMILGMLTAEIATPLIMDALGLEGAAATEVAATTKVATEGIEMVGEANSVSKVAKNLVEGGEKNTMSRAGKDFTVKEKQKVIDANLAKNEGKIKCENCGVETTKPQKSEKGVTPPKTDRQVDHIIPKSKGGSGTSENGQVLCRDCNVKKGKN